MKKIIFALLLFSACASQAQTYSNTPNYTLQSTTSGDKRLQWVNNVTGVAWNPYTIFLTKTQADTYYLNVNSLSPYSTAIRTRQTIDSLNNLYILKSAIGSGLSYTNGVLTANGQTQDLSPYLTINSAQNTYQPKGDFIPRQPILYGNTPIDGALQTGVYRNENGAGGVYAFSPTLVLNSNDTGIELNGNYQGTSLQFRGSYNFGANKTPWQQIWNTANFDPNGKANTTGTYDGMAVGNALNADKFAGYTLDANAYANGFDYIVGRTANTNQFRLINPGVFQPAGNYLTAETDPTVPSFSKILDQSVSKNSIPIFQTIAFGGNPETGLNIDKIAVGTVGTSTLHYAAPATVSVGRSSVSGSIDNQGGLATQNTIAYNQISNPPAIPTDNTQIGNGRGYITGFTETDPTVPGFAKSLNQGVSTGNSPTFVAVIAGTHLGTYFNSNSPINLAQQASNGQSADLGARFSISNTSHPITYFGQPEARKIDLGEDYRGAYIQMFSPVNNFLDYKGDAFISHNAQTGVTTIPGLKTAQPVPLEAVASGSSNVIAFAHNLTGVTNNSTVVINPANQAAGQMWYYYQYTTKDANYIYLHFSNFPPADTYQFDSYITP